MAGAELDFLLACARGDGAPAEIPADLEWPRFLDLAAAHGLRPLVYWRLREVSPRVAALGEWFQANAQHNLALTAELVRVTTRLRNAGVEAVSFKGPALAAQLHGNVALRESTDIDLFVRAEQVPRVKEVLASLPYRPSQQLTPQQERAFLRSGCELTFDHDAGFCLDVHWQAAPAHFCARLPEAVWNRLQALSIAGAELRVFAPEDLLVLLSIHGTKHLWRRLVWVEDVAALARMKLDWDALWRCAREMRARRMVLLGLRLACELLGAPLPPEVARAASSFDQSVKRIMVDVRRGADPMQVSVADHRFLMGLRDSRRDQARYLLGLAFTPAVADWETLPSSSRVPGLYRLVRVARLARKFLWKPTGRMHSDIS
jgi:hypothetical protein